MKYLKTFESHSDDINNIISTLNDIYQELNDTGFTIDSNYVHQNTDLSGNSYDEFVSTGISKRTNVNPLGTSNVHSFNTDEVYDDILRSIEYMNEQGWMLHKIHVAGLRGRRVLQLKDLRENKSVLVLNLNWKRK